MKATASIAIVKNAHTLVDVGDEVSCGTAILAIPADEKTEIIPLAQILRIEAAKIAKYLKKRVGEKVALGEVLAEKKSLLSSSILKSPHEGLLKEIDLKKGTLTLVLESAKSHKISLPVSGKIIKVTPHQLEIEVNGRSLKGEKGEGAERVGKLIYIEGGKNVLDTEDDAEGCIVLCKSLLPETVVKLEVLGALGVITLKNLPEGELSWIAVSEENFNHLVSFVSEKVWLRPREKQIIILE